MSHTVTVKMIADQVIGIAGKEVNIHDIYSIYVNSKGEIVEVALLKEQINAEDATLK